MVATYSEYHRDRIGWFFGLQGWQLVLLAVAALPVLGLVQRGAWTAALAGAGVWVLTLVVVAVPVRGRSATGWLLASLAFLLGRRAGWTRWRSRAATGAAQDLAEADLPGVLQAVQIHDGPPHGPHQVRVAVAQNHALSTWAVTAQVTHPGIGMADSADRDRQGHGLAELLDLAARTELIEEVLFTVRTVPDDGAERDLWVRKHRKPGGPELSRRVNDDLRQSLTGASVRTETFVTLVVPEARMGRPAREAGGRLEGRARVLYGLMGEVEAQLSGGLGMTQVAWLTSPQLALVCRTGFAPGDRAGIVEALAAHTQDSGVNADVPWALAGPSGADPVARHYSHDAWNSVSVTLQLPTKGAVLGALAPVLTPGEAGERRSLLVAFPILAQSVADRRTANNEWAADLGEELRARARMKVRARQRAETAKARGVDVQLARGSCLTRPYAVATVTVPKTARVAEYGRRLDAAVRRAGFAPLRLDLAHDVAFAASTVPLGVSLTRKATR
ncbi:hypothetical protein SAMN04488543_2812 [Friedmanniella luteola]|uniref:PrgI family protein n=1 Tax=Friedmanniella luteola TaxID=546871 RepID=A0A1H1WU66_9ACTN|nr:hypothetical protein SAMN04488543_2812 [Friedmanniella luteola]